MPRIKSFILFALLLAAAAMSAAPAADSKSRDDGRLVEYEVTLREMPASNAAAVLERVAAVHHGIVTKLDVEGGRAIVRLPANRAAELVADAHVTATPSNGTSTKRLDRFKPVTMTQIQWDSGSYSYDGAGNITAIGDDMFAYDAVNRVTSGKVRGIEQSYAYDAFGNRLSGSHPAPGCAQGLDCAIDVTTDSTTNRLTQTMVMTVTDPVVYDDAGNVTSFAGTTFEYDALGNMVWRNDGEGPRFVYDANDERVGWHNRAEWKWTVRDVAGRQLREYTTPTQPWRTKWSSGSWTWTRDHIYRGDQLLASVTPSVTGTITQHLHVDHLGTPRVITQDGMPVAFKSYYPFGAEQPSAPVESPAENHKFTGHEFDDVNNTRFATDYMHARYYNATAGRFLSVDPAMDVEKNAVEPQQWNRYAYVSNNPVAFVDTNGKEGAYSLHLFKAPPANSPTEKWIRRGAIGFGVAAATLAAPELAARVFSKCLGNLVACTALVANALAPPGPGVDVPLPEAIIPGPDKTQFGKIDYILGAVTEGPNVQKSQALGGFFVGELGLTQETAGAAITKQFTENFGSRVLSSKGLYEITGTITGANGKTATVRTVWKQVGDNTFSFVTAKPN